MEFQASEPTYGGFWRRFAALWLDGLILAPMAVGFFWADSLSRFAPAYYFIPGIVLSLFYNVYLVQRFGGTPGKLLMGLIITKVDGLPIGRRQAFLRFLPEFLFALFMGIAMTLASYEMTDADQQLPWTARHQRRADLAPGLKTVQTLNQVWIWSEFIVLLTNKKRRAIHDFLAGTVVVRRRLTTASR